MDYPNISALLPTFNCEKTIRGTLQSIQWADEIVVVDSYSSDNTLNICREFGARIIQHEYINSAKQKNWAAKQCLHSWVLQIDSDEILEEGLETEIRQAVVNAAEQVHCYQIPRKNFFAGVWLRYGGNYPDYQRRLFRRDEGHWMDREVHAHIEVSGQIQSLRGHIIHNDWPYLAKPLNNLNRYTRYEADELYKLHKHFHWIDLVIRPWVVFWYIYIVKRAYRDSWRGYIFSVYMAMYVFLTRAKLWELDELELEKSPK